MGHKLTDNGVGPDPTKVAAITEMPKPTDKAGVQRFLGMCQYLSKFCHNLPETGLPLRAFTKEDSVFYGQTIMKMHSSQQMISLLQQPPYDTMTQPFQ